MGRPDLERLSREELIELVLRLQRPAKTSRTSSKPPPTDRKERREASRRGGGRPGDEGHSRILSEAFDLAIDHRPDTCSGCCAALPADLVAETVSEHDTVELPPITPVVERHRRLAVRCPSCGMRVTAALPDAATGTPFGARIHAIATYLKSFQALSYERLQGAFADLFGLTISQGGLMNMLRRAEAHFAGGRDDAVSKLRQAGVVSSDETGVRIEGSNAYQWVFRCDQAVVHTAAPTRGKRTIDDIIATPRSCELTMKLRNRFARAREQLLTFAYWPGRVEPTNNACECDLRPFVIQRKITNGYRAMWAAQGEADIRTVVATARLTLGTNIFGTIAATLGA
jgi:transposase